jgi:hypothetical protein
MKRLPLILFFCFLFNVANAQELSFEDYLLQENCPNWICPVYGNSIEVPFDVVVINDINPFYLEADFNGDEQLDIAFFVKRKSDEKKGILIVHGKSGKTFLLGAGKSFGNGGDNWNWLEVWKAYRAKTVEKTIFSDSAEIAGSETVQLQNIAIEVPKVNQLVT